MMTRYFMAFFAKDSLVQVGTIAANTEHEADMAWREYLESLNQQFIWYAGQGVVELPASRGTVELDVTGVMHYPATMVCVVEWALPSHYLVTFVLYEKLKVGDGWKKGNQLHVEKFEVPRGEPIAYTSFFELKIKPRYSEHGEISDEEVEDYFWRLSDLAASWREAQPVNGQSPSLNLDIVQEYERIFLELLDRGWNMTGLDVEAMLPNTLMPEDAFQHLLPDIVDLVELLHYLVAEYSTSTRQLVYEYSYDLCLNRLIELGWDLENATGGLELPGTPLTIEGFKERNRW